MCVKYKVKSKVLVKTINNSNIYVRIKKKVIQISEHCNLKNNVYSFPILTGFFLF